MRRPLNPWREQAAAVSQPSALVKRYSAHRMAIAAARCPDAIPSGGAYFGAPGTARPATAEAQARRALTRDWAGAFLVPELLSITTNAEAKAA
jgi:hypothetical protein